MLFTGKALHSKAVRTVALAVLTAAPMWAGAISVGPQPQYSPDAVTPRAGNSIPEMPLVSASADVRHALRWIMDARDNQGLPFVLVDKKAGRIFVFESTGLLRGASPALTGLTPGDHSVPGLAQRSVASLRADERTTPAGRFISEPGHNLRGEAIVWIDYAAKLAIHRLRPAPAAERRADRLASETPDDNRISLGCVVVPASFYDTVVSPMLGKSHGVVYVLPETQPLQNMLGALQFSQQ